MEAFPCRASWARGRAASADSNVVRFTPESGQIADLSECPLCAISGREQMQQVAPLLNHLVGGGEQPWWKGEAKSKKPTERVSQTERSTTPGSDPAAALAHRT